MSMLVSWFLEKSHGISIRSLCSFITVEYFLC